jgi:hypothetical protein
MEGKRRLKRQRSKRQQRAARNSGRLFLSSVRGRPAMFEKFFSMALTINHHRHLNCFLLFCQKLLMRKERNKNEKP